MSVENLSFSRPWETTKNRTMDLELVGLPSTGKKQRELDDYDRMSIVAMLIGMGCKGELPHGSFRVVAEKFRIDRATVSRIWKRATTARSEGRLVREEIFSMKTERGKKPKWDKEETKEAIKAIPLKKDVPFVVWLRSLVCRF